MSCSTDSYSLYIPDTPTEAPPGDKIVYTSYNVAPQGPNQHVFYFYKLEHASLEQNSIGEITHVKFYIANNEVYSGPVKDCYTYRDQTLVQETAGTYIIPPAKKSGRIEVTYSNGIIKTFQKDISFVNSIEATVSCN